MEGKRKKGEINTKGEKREEGATKPRELEVGGAYGREEVGRF